MKEDLVEAIKSKGYWRINFRPITLPKPLLPLGRCFDTAQRATIGLRGWNYPHIPTRSDESRGIDYLDNCVQCWSGWSRHLEFWRLYTSEQFLYYLAIAEDWNNDDAYAGTLSPPRRPQNSSLGVTDTTWLMTETFEFLARLSQHGFYKDGARASIQLHNTSGRQLYIDEINRAPFATERTTAAESINYERMISFSEIQQPKSRAKEVIEHIFERFNWRPNSAQLESDINRLYQLRMDKG